MCPEKHFKSMPATMRSMWEEYILKLDGYSYDMMNLLDYLVGNADRHWGNWGFLVDNRTNQPVRLHPLMDFNQFSGLQDGKRNMRCQRKGFRF